MAEEFLFSWVHISDIHFGHGDAKHRWDQQLVLTALTEDAERCAELRLPHMDAILVTGDLAFSGNVRYQDEYTGVARWLKKLAVALTLDVGKVFVIPGNHDVQRDVDSVDKRSRDLVEALRSGQKQIDNVLGEAPDRSLLKKRILNYINFAHEFGPSRHESERKNDDLYWVHSLPLPNDLTVRLVGLNSALLCAKEEDEFGDRARLQVGKEQIATAFTSQQVRRDREIVIVLSHHPFDWLRDQMEVLAAVKQYAHIMLCGHIHDAQSERNRSGSGADFIQVVSGAAHDEPSLDRIPPRHGYNFGSVVRREDGRLYLRIWPRIWSKNHGFRADRDSLPDIVRGRAYKKDYVDHELRLSLRAIQPSVKVQAKTTAKLVIDIRDWLEPNGLKLLKDIFALVEDSVVPDTLSVSLNAPQYDRLRECVSRQAQQGLNRDIVAEQLSALHRADSLIPKIEEWCARLLVNVSKHHGIHRAVRSSEYFLRFLVAFTVSSLASYQQDGPDVVCREFEDWFERRSAPYPSVVHFTYRTPELLEVIIAETAHPSDSTASDKVYVPVGRLSNDGYDELITFLWERATYIPVDVWLDYVVPQLAIRNALGISKYCPWTPESAFYATEGEIWLRSKTFGYPKKKIGDSHHWIVPNVVP
jgi:predicted MPP superfamily phosphohydrolase